MKCQPEKQKKAAHITNRKTKMTARDVKTCSHYSVNLMSARGKTAEKSKKMVSHAGICRQRLYFFCKNFAYCILQQKNTAGFFADIISRTGDDKKCI